MASALTDKFRKGAPFFQTTLGGSMSDSDTTFTIASATGLPTDTAIDFVIDRIDQNGELLDPSLREVITGTVSGTTITTDATRRGLDNTTAQAHTAGAVVEVNFTADTWNDHIDGILASHNQDGTIKDDAVDTAQIADSAVTTAKIAGEAVTTPKLKPSSFKFIDTATSNFTTTSTTYVDVTGITTTYTTGATSERLFIWVSGMCQTSGASSATLTANINGVQQTDDVAWYTPGTNVWTVFSKLYIYDAPAATGVTIKLQAKTNGGTFTFNRSTGLALGSIRGFAISNA